MDREKANLYVKNSIDNTAIASGKMQNGFLLLSISCFVVSAIIYNDPIYLGILIAVVLVDCLINILLLWNKKIFIQQSLVLANICFFGIALNFVSFSILKTLEEFRLWFFLLPLAIQFVCFFVSFVVVVRHANKFELLQENNKNRDVVAGVAATVSGLFFSVAVLLCRIFAPTVFTLSVIFLILIYALACLLNFGDSAAMYRVWLIKKYKIE